MEGLGIGLLSSSRTCQMARKLGLLLLPCGFVFMLTNSVPDGPASLQVELAFSSKLPDR